MCALWTCWWCLCKSTILKQMFPSLTGFRCPLICMVVLVLCQEPLREAVSPYRGSQRRNKRSWLETSVWVNYLPQFLEQLSVMLGYFSKAHFECIKSNNWHAGQQMTVLKNYLPSRLFVPVLILFSAQDCLFSFPDHSNVNACFSGKLLLWLHLHRQESAWLFYRAMCIKLC